MDPRLLISEYDITLPIVFHVINEKINPPSLFFALVSEPTRSYIMP